jgi:ZIP family zinc transporter
MWVGHPARTLFWTSVDRKLPTFLNSRQWPRSPLALDKCSPVYSMLEAALWGGFAASSLIVGAVIALVFHPRSRIVGSIMAFGAGALISAVAYELVADSLEDGELEGIVLGLLAGSLTYFGADWYIDNLGGGGRGKIESEEQGADMGIVLGTVLDGVPESFVTGMTIVTGGGASLAFVASVFLSNLPESLASTTTLEKSGWPTSRILIMWIGITVLCAVSAALGFAVFDAVSTVTGHIVKGFAAGAILTMLAQTMMPEAFEKGGRLVGVITVCGFIVALALTLAE